MNREQARLVALGVAAFAVIMIFVSKRASTDIAAAVIALLGAGYALAVSVPDWAAAWRKRRQRETPWTMFSAPHPTDDTKWEVGIRRHTDDGVDLDIRTLTVLGAEDELEIAVAEEQARVKAQRWTENRVRM